jgi:hypothetical protein
MPFGPSSAPAMFQREINRILHPLLGMELVINLKLGIDDDGAMVVVAYIKDILIATKGSLRKHYNRVSKVVQLPMDNHLSVEIDQCIFNAKEVPFQGIMVSRAGLRMDPDKAKAIVDWPRPTQKKAVPQLLGLWNFYSRFVPS